MFFFPGTAKFGAERFGEARRRARHGILLGDGLELSLDSQEHVGQIGVELFARLFAN